MPCNYSYKWINKKKLKYDRLTHSLLNAFNWSSDDVNELNICFVAAEQRGYNYH